MPEKKSKKLSKEFYIIIFFVIVLGVIGITKLPELFKKNNEQSIESSEVASSSEEVATNTSSQEASSEEPDTRINWDDYGRYKSQTLEPNGITGYIYKGVENLKEIPEEVIETFKKHLKDTWGETNVVVEFISGSRVLNELGTYTVIIEFNATDEYNFVENYDYISNDDGKTEYHFVIN